MFCVNSMCVCRKWILLYFKRNYEMISFYYRVIVFLKLIRYNYCTLKTIYVSAIWLNNLCVWHLDMIHMRIYFIFCFVIVIMATIKRFSYLYAFHPSWEWYHLKSFSTSRFRIICPWHKSLIEDSVEIDIRWLSRSVMCIYLKYRHYHNNLYPITYPLFKNIDIFYVDLM